MSNELLQAHAYYHTSDFPQEVWGALLRNEAAANTILPFAKNALDLPRQGDKEQLWIALCDDAKNVVFMLSCTTGPMGNYPIFVVACEPFTKPAQEGGIVGAMLALVHCLLEEGVPPARVFSVFSTDNVSRAFAAAFEAHVAEKHGIRAYYEKPYYIAAFAFCTVETLSKTLDTKFTPRDGEDVIIALRRADMSHLEGVKRLCKVFSEGSWPYDTLDDTGAELEARTMIENQQAWVHLIQKDNQEPEVACLVATTRESENVTAVTKVVTGRHWLGRRCATRLLYRVCHEVLHVQRKQRVVLYVGTSESYAAAHKLYHNIGFKGLEGVLDPLQANETDVDKWVEIGFKGTTLGYW